MIADRHTMRIAAEIPEDGRRSAKGRLDVDHPVGTEERVDEGVPSGWVAECRRRTAEVQFAARVRPAETRDKFAAKHPTEDFHRQEEAGVLRVHPALVIRGHANGRHDAMDMRMADERLSPRVQDAEES